MRSMSEIVRSLAPQKKVFIAGSAFVDVVIRIPAMPTSGADLEGECRMTSVGGCSFNVADVLHKLGLPFESLMPVGDGMMSLRVAETFRERGYPIRRYPGFGDNGWCLSLVEPEGERTFISMSGIETRMQPAWFDAFDMAAFDIVYLSGYQLEGANARVVLDAVKRCRPDAELVIDLGPRAAAMPKDLLSEICSLHPILKLNDQEAQAVTGNASAEAASRVLSEMTGAPAVVTDGARGAVLAADGAVQLVEGYPCKVADTIGSGDAHAGGFIAGRMCGLPLEESVRLANAVASVVTSREGAACAPTLAELQALHYGVA